MHIGYARVSTHEQNLDFQKDGIRLMNYTPPKCIS